MIAFDAAHQAVHAPPDRRFRVWIRPALLLAVCLMAVLPVFAAWIQAALLGLPPLPSLAPADPRAFTQPSGFPLWARSCHFFNFFFLTMLIRSGLSILMDHPRLYFNDHCTPGSEWIRFTPLEVPRDRVWTGKQDARYISPLVATPGYRHTVGIARSWHFLNVYGFVATGIVFVAMLLGSGQWRRLAPESPRALVEAWSTWVHYATFHMPPEPNGFYRYNALQQLAYFAVVFLLGPLAIFTGMAMSPAAVNRFPWYARLFGGRQAARSIHFLVLASFVGFLAVHVALVVLAGFARNMNHIVLGTDDPGRLGLILGLVGIGLVFLSWVVAHHISWLYPRALQHAERLATYPLMLATLNRLAPSGRYTEKDISPRFWPNGKIPTRDDWTRLARDGFRDYKLKIGGLVDNPVELSLSELEALGKAEFITMQHCIQGYSGIAKWGGVPMKTLVELVRPKPAAKVVAFFSFGESLFGGPYYDTQRIDNVLKTQCLLALEMNGAALPDVYGAPLRLRAENQLGYKMVKWIERIEFIESEMEVGQGEGGKNEDDEYYDLLPNI